MKNLLMLTTQMSLGGAEKVFYQHVREFSKKYHVTVCLFTKDNFYPHFTIDNEIIELDDKPISNSIKRWWYRKQKLGEIIKEKQIDVCISHMEGPNILLSWSNTGSCKKVLCVHGSIHGDIAKSALKKKVLNKAVLPLSYRKAAKVVAVSKAMGAELRGIGLPAPKVVSIPNFFEVNRIEQLSWESLEAYAPIFEGSGTLVHAGRLSREKNQKVLLDMLAAAKVAGMSKKLCIVGEGELKQDLLARAQANGLKVYEPEGAQPLHADYDVYFVGNQTNPYRFMARAEAFVLSSFFEGFPLVLGEALACGIPVISVDCETGPREILCNDGQFKPQAATAAEPVACGVLVPDYYTDAPDSTQLSVWLDALRKLQDKDWYAGTKANCLEKVSAYRKETIVTDWLNLIDTL